MKMSMTITFDPMRVNPKELANAALACGVAEGDIKLSTHRNGDTKKPAAKKA